MEQKIVPHLWFDKEAIEAARFYTSIFPDSSIQETSVLHDTPSGSVETVSFVLAGVSFSAISAGPVFKFNPSISFTVTCQNRAETDALWEKLSAGGQVLMEYGAYPFSPLFGWLVDRYGLSWQVMLSEASTLPKITPSLMFAGPKAGQAEEAMRLYTSLFPDSRILYIDRHGPDEAPDREGTVKQAAFSLAGQVFTAIDSAYEHGFDFNEAISFMVSCRDQAEIDFFWGRLSAVPEAEQCGWLKDRFGVSWQIVPARLGAMLSGGRPDQQARVTEAFLGMKKLDLEELERVYAG